MELERNTEVPMPYLYPTPQGGVLAEWELRFPSEGKWAISAELCPNLSWQFHALHEAGESELTADIPGDWPPDQAITHFLTFWSAIFLMA